MHVTCDWGVCNLPNLYILSPRASGIHIRQIPYTHVKTDTQTAADLTTLIHLSTLPYVRGYVHSMKHRYTTIGCVDAIGIVSFCNHGGCMISKYVTYA